MSVVLATSSARRRRPLCDAWVRVGNGGSADGVNVSTALETALAAAEADLLALARRLGAAPTADLAHAPSAAVVASDLGTMMAWTRLVDGWAAETRRILVLCDDPWLFRHLAGRPGIAVHGRAPRLWPRRLSLALRGIAARALFALRAAGWAIASRRPKIEAGAPWLLSYGQAAPRPGEDGYFGDLMNRLPRLRRALHVDCPPGRAASLGADRRTASLHAWGGPAAALGTAFARWRPGAEALSGPWAWLVRRAADREGGTAQAAAIRWQTRCQRAWLTAARPTAIAWPWENHGWERDLVRAARALGIRTIGYQHSTIGRFEFNHHPAINGDGEASLPDLLLCVGPLGCGTLAAWGMPAERLRIGGALRYAGTAGPRRDPAAPVFVALPFGHPQARQLVEAVRRAAAATGLRFVVRGHPMNPLPFAETEQVRQAAGGLGEQTAVSAVVYAATTVGLEAVLLGLPTLRFVTRGCVAQDILPNNVHVPSVDGDSLAAALERLPTPPSLDRAEVFAPVDLNVWRAALEEPTVCP